MIIRPCSTCHLRKGCVRYGSIKCEFSCVWIDLKSLMAKISCDWFDRLYSPGVRVMVELHEYWRGDHEMPEIYKEGLYSGTIIGCPRGGKIAVWMDDNEDVACKIIKVSLRRLTFISQQPVNTCSSCGRPEGKVNHSGWSCDECDGTAHDVKRAEGEEK